MQNQQLIEMLMKLPNELEVRCLCPDGYEFIVKHVEIIPSLDVHESPYIQLFGAESEAAIEAIAKRKQQGTVYTDADARMLLESINKNRESGDIKIPEALAKAFMEDYRIRVEEAWKKANAETAAKQPSLLVATPEQFREELDQKPNIQGVQDGRSEEYLKALEVGKLAAIDFKGIELQIAADEHVKTENFLGQEWQVTHRDPSDDMIKKGVPAEEDWPVKKVELSEADKRFVSDFAAVEEDFMDKYGDPATWATTVDDKTIERVNRYLGMGDIYDNRPPAQETGRLPRIVGKPVTDLNTIDLSRNPFGELPELPFTPEQQSKVIQQFTDTEADTPHTSTPKPTQIHTGEPSESNPTGEGQSNPVS